MTSSLISLILNALNIYQTYYHPNKLDKATMSSNRILKSETNRSGRRYRDSGVETP